MHQPEKLNPWLTPGRFALVLGAFIFAAFPQVLLGLSTFVVRDFGFFAYPLAHYQRECFWRGEWPLWNPYNNCGVPFLAQWNTMPLYPPALIYLLLPLSWSLSFFALAHLFWAGLGMYFLGRRWTDNLLAAALAGVVFAFNGFTLNLLMWPSHIATLSWMPWVVLAAERGWQMGGRKLLLAAAAGAFQMLAGGPETIAFTWLVVLALWLTDSSNSEKDLIEKLRDRKIPEAVRPNFSVSKFFCQIFLPAPGSFADGPAASLPRAGASSRQRRLLLSLARLALIVALVATLAAVQLLPFLDLVAHSQRQSGYADTRWSLPGRGWANFLVPMVFGSVWNKGLFFQYDQAWTSSYYLGVGALLLALLAPLTLRQRRVWLLSALAILALVLAFGNQTPVGRGLRSLVPQLSMVTYPVKFLTLVTFAAPLLAGFALTRLQSEADEHRKRLRSMVLLLTTALLVLIAAILFWAWRWPFPTDDFSATLRNGLGRAGFLLGAAALLWTLLRPAQPVAAQTQAAMTWRFQRCVPLLLLLLCWLDVWTHEPPQNPTVAPWIYTPGLARTKLALAPQPELGESRSMLTPAAEARFRQFLLSDFENNFLVKRLGYFADCNLLDGVPKVDGFFSLYPREAGELMSVLYGSTNASFPRVADFLSVSQMTRPGEYFEWEPRPTFQPLVTAGQRPVFLDDTNALAALLAPEFDGRKFVLLPPETKALVSVTQPSQARIVSQHFTPERVDVQVEAAAACLVVVAQTYYHSWRAYVDDRPTSLLRANYAFQALEIPAGTHQVRLAYEDGAFHTGATITGLSLLTCLTGWIWLARQR